MERERAALLDVLRSIARADWHLPSPCPGWSVHDLVLHILGTDVGVISRQRDGHIGTPGPDTTSEVAFEAFEYEAGVQGKLRKEFCVFGI